MSSPFDACDLIVGKMPEGSATQREAGSIRQIALSCLLRSARAGGTDEVRYRPVIYKHQVAGILANELDLDLHEPGGTPWLFLLGCILEQYRSWLLGGGSVEFCPDSIERLEHELGIYR
ncbi:MAG: hypothetical protein ACKO0Z_18245 [Betaproteobacteria bacterium]